MCRGVCSGSGAYMKEVFQLKSWSLEIRVYGPNEPEPIGGRLWNALANPKSAIRKDPSLEMRRLAAFMSRWSMLFCNAQR